MAANELRAIADSLAPADRVAVDAILAVLERQAGQIALLNRAVVAVNQLDDMRAGEIRELRLTVRLLCQLQGLETVGEPLHVLDDRYAADDLGRVEPEPLASRHVDGAAADEASRLREVLPPLPARPDDPIQAGGEPWILCPRCNGSDDRGQLDCPVCQSAGVLDAAGEPFFAPPPFSGWTPAKLVQLAASSRRRAGLLDGPAIGGDRGRS